MAENFIETDYQVLSPDDGGTDITINADPGAAAVTGLFRSIDNVTNAVREYNMCKQQEKTKREEIKAQMKVQIETIHAQKEAYLKRLEAQHTKDMFELKQSYDMLRLELDRFSEGIRAGIEIARETKDMAGLCQLLETQRYVIRDINEAQLKNMEMQRIGSLPDSNSGKLLEIKEGG